MTFSNGDIFPKVKFNWKTSSVTPFFISLNVFLLVFYHLRLSKVLLLYPLSLHLS